MERLSDFQLQNFLYQDENTFLDFKSQQYDINHSDNQTKSKLLKDVLAFANSWRDGDAYIVIGVEDKKGEKNKVVGCDNHHDDATIQQLVNSKTNRKIKLSYEVYELEDKKIGVIRISKQKRPFYTQRDFGSVKKEVVYYRLGSSNAEANPQDIYNMGKDDHDIKQLTPILDLKFVNPFDNQEEKKELSIKNTCYAQPNNLLPDAIEKKLVNDSYRLNISINEVNRDYWRELEEYTRMINFLVPCQFSITNTSECVTHNAHIEIKVKLIDKVEVRTLEELPTKPSSDHFQNITRSIVPIQERLRKKNTILKVFNKELNLILDIGDIKPKSTVYSDVFAIGAKESMSLNLNPFIYASNLPNPQKFNLIINFDVQQLSSLTIKELKNIHSIDDGIYPKSFYDQ